MFRIAILPQAAPSPERAATLAAAGADGRIAPAGAADAGATNTAVSTQIALDARGARLDLAALSRGAAEARGAGTAALLIDCPVGRNRDRALCEWMEALRAYADGPANPKLLLCNGAPEPDAGLDSSALWLVHDGLASESIGLACDLSRGAAAGESPSVMLPRLARGLRLILLTAGDRAVDVARSVEILRGLAFDGWVCVDLRGADDEAAERAIAEVRSLRDRPRVPLTAYERDTHPTRFVSRRAR